MDRLLANMWIFYANSTSASPLTNTVTNLDEARAFRTRLCKKRRSGEEKKEGGRGRSLLKA